jgi:hypothetical protein
MNTTSYLNYGYKVIGDLPANMKKAFKTLFLPTGKRETWTGKKFRRYVANGTIKKVDPELLSPEYQKRTGKGWQDTLTAHDFSQMDLPKWDTQSVLVKDRAVKLFNTLQRDLMLGRDVAICRTGHDEVNKSRLYAMMAVLSNFKFTRDHFAVFIITTSDGPEFFMINQDTLHLMKKIINAAFYGKADPFMGVEKSDYAQHFTANDWKKMEIVFQEDGDGTGEGLWLNFLDNRPSQKEPEAVVPKRRKHRAGLFMFLNGTPSDLSRFGIYNTFNVNNYRTNCLVQAIQNAECLDDEEINLLKWIIKTATIKLSDLAVIGELFKLEFHVSKWSDEKGAINHTKTYAKGGAGRKKIHLFHRDGHLMLMEKTTALGGKPIWISTVIEKMFRAGQLFPLTYVQANQALRARLDVPPLEAVKYSPLCLDVGKRTMEHMVLKDIDRILDVDEIKAMEDKTKGQLFRTFKCWIQRKFGLSPDRYRSLACLGHAILEGEGCFAGVPALGGPVGEFIRLCQTSPLCEAQFNRPVKVEGELVQIDRRGSYCSVYKDFQGIPTGPPIPIQGDKPFRGRDWDYYYICINVISFKLKECMGSEDPFPLIRKTGLLYLDMELFATIKAWYDLEYDLISGFGFTGGFNTNVKKVAVEMWQLRMEIQPPVLAKVVKRMINSMFGKSIQKEKLTYQVTYDKDHFFSYLRLTKLTDGIFSVKKRGDSFSVTFAHSIVVNWIRPQFGVNVLSWSRTMMGTYMWCGSSVGVNVFYVNTDSMVMTKEDAKKLNMKCNWQLIGDKLGTFSYEFPNTARKFICLSKKKYLFCFNDGTFKVRFGPQDERDPEEYFEAKYAELTQ